MTNQLDLKIDVKNFQIIKDASFCFPAGTVSLVVGASGNGKTSLLRAVRTLLLNTSGSQKFIRHGTEEAEVKMSYGGHSVIWKRTQSGAKYTIDGSDYSKLGTKNILDYLPDNGFVIDQNNSILNLEGAWDVLFPFNKSDAELFKLFENIFCVSDSGTIFQAFKMEDNRLSKELEDCEKEIEKNSTKIKAIEDLQNKVDINKLKKYKEKYANLSNDYAEISKNLVVLNSIKKYLSVVKPGKVVIFNLDKMREYETLNKDIKVLESVNKYPVVDSSVIIFNLDKVITYEKLYKDIHIIKESNKYPFVKGKSINFTLDKIKDYESLRNNISFIKEVHKYPAVAGKVRVFDTSKLDTYTKIKKDINNILKLKEENKFLKEGKDRIDNKILEINEKISKFPKCEVCGSVLQDDKCK